MAYSDFKSVEQVIQIYPLQIRPERLIPALRFEPPSWFIENWEFGKLETNIFAKHPLAYSITDPAKVFGIFDFIFTACEKQLNGSHNS